MIKISESFMTTSFHFTRNSKTWYKIERVTVIELVCIGDQLHAKWMGWA